MKSTDEIVENCLSGGAISPQNITATAMRAYAISPFACFCHFHVNPKEQDPGTHFGELLKTWGLELERAYVDGKDPNARKKKFSYDHAGFKSFVTAALAGEKYIYNPPLFYLKENLAGKPDLLVRDDSYPSDFGNHHYRVTEIKFSSKFEEKNKRHYLLQALLYNLLLSKVQGYLPTKLTMADRHLGETVLECGVYEAELRLALKEMEDIRTGKLRPEPVFDTCGDAYWGNYCDAKAEAARDISLVPYLKDDRIRTQMVKAGIRTIDDLAKLSPDEISRFKWVGKRSDLIFQQNRCLVTEKESVMSRVVFPVTKGPEVYLDLEDTGSVHPRIPHFVFLIGATVRNPGSTHVSHSFVIHSEKEIPQRTNEFLALLDTLGDYQVYSWSKKEIVEFAKIFDTYGLANSSVQMFTSRCVDLKDIFEGKVYFPVHGNSVKQVAKFLGYKWREEGVDAMEGMALTYEYLESGNKEALKKVQTYNEDDCLAMMTIKDWLVWNAT